MPGPVIPSRYPAIDWRQAWKTMLGNKTPVTGQEVDPSLADVPFSPLAVTYPAGKTVYHGTRRVFKYFKPSIFGDLEQPAAKEFIHAAENPRAAVGVALEPRPGRSGLRFPEIKRYVNKETRFSSIPEHVRRGLRLIPIKVPQGAPFLDVENILPEEADRLLRSGLIPKESFAFTKLRNIVESGKPGSIHFDNIKPSMLDKLGQFGAVYSDLYGKAFMFPEVRPLFTPSGVPLTESAARLTSLGGIR